MAIITDDLLTNPAAQSFISLEDADAYLAPEQRHAWDAAPNDQREAALVQASRWLVAAYRLRPLDAVGLVRVGHIVARLAAETLAEGSLNLFTGTNTAKAIKSIKAGSVDVVYQDTLKADAAGRAWSWLDPMLSGLLLPRLGIGIGALVV